MNPKRTRLLVVIVSVVVALGSASTGHWFSDPIPARAVGGGGLFPWDSLRECEAQATDLVDAHCEVGRDPFGRPTGRYELYGIVPAEPARFRFDGDALMRGASAGLGVFVALSVLVLLWQALGREDRGRG